jgi:hypothetical protein
MSSCSAGRQRNVGQLKIRPISIFSVGFIWGTPVKNLPDQPTLGLYFRASAYFRAATGWLFCRRLRKFAQSVYFRYIFGQAPFSIFSGQVPIRNLWGAGCKFARSGYFCAATGRLFMGPQLKICPIRKCSGTHPVNILDIFGRRFKMRDQLIFGHLSAFLVRGWKCTRSEFYRAGTN